MVFVSSSEVPIPIASIPSLVFKTISESLPTYPAFINLDDPTSVSLSLQDYRLLSQRFAEGLRRQGLQNGDRVMLASENSVVFPVIFMGTLMAGGVFVGVNRSNSTHDLILKIQQTGPRIILLANDNLDRIEDILRSGNHASDTLFHFSDALNPPEVDGEIAHWSGLLSDGEQAKDFQWPVFTSREEADQVATLIYSSGSSGDPKAVVMTHYQIVATVVQGLAHQRAEMRPEVLNMLRNKPALAHMSLSQVLGQLQVCVVHPLIRAPVWITTRSDFVSMQDHIIRHELPMAVVYPTFIYALMKNDVMKKRVSEMKSLRTIILTGGPVSETLCLEFMRQWMEITGQPLPIRTAYGMTEVGGGILTTIIGMPNKTLVDCLYPNIKLKIMTLDGSTEVNDGVEGEIWIGGPHVAQSYWRDPELTASTFREDGWVRTGDIGSVGEGGTLSIVGRRKDLVGSPGKLMVPLRLEEVLLSHPDVEEAVVCSVAAGPGTTHRNARAYVRKRQDSTLDAPMVMDFLKSRAPQLPDLEGGVSFPIVIPVVSNHKPEREFLMAQDPELAA